MAVTKLRLALLADGDYDYVIAAKARVSPARLSQWANGRVRIPPHALAKLSVVLKTDPHDLVGYANPADHFVT